MDKAFFYTKDFRCGLVSRNDIDIANAVRFTMQDENENTIYIDISASETLKLISKLKEWVSEDYSESPEQNLNWKHYSKVFKSEMLQRFLRYWLSLFSSLIAYYDDLYGYPWGRIQLLGLFCVGFAFYCGLAYKLFSLN